MAPIDFADFLASERRGEKLGGGALLWMRTFDQRCRPWPRAVAELVRRGKVAALITQNIDGLHQASGIAEEQVIELTATRPTPIASIARLRYELEALRIDFERDGTAPFAALAAALSNRDDILWPGDAVEPMRRSEFEAAGCGFVHRWRLVAGGLSGGGIPGAGAPYGATFGNHQS